MASERERLSTIKIVVFYIIVSVTFLFGQAFPTSQYSICVVFSSHFDAHGIIHRFSLHAVLAK